MIVAGDEVAALRSATSGESLACPPEWPRRAGRRAGRRACARSASGLAMRSSCPPTSATPFRRRASVGATPALCDVESDWCMSARTVAATVTSRTRAVLSSCIRSASWPMRRRSGARRPVVEDCCQAFRAPGTGWWRRGGRPVVSRDQAPDDRRGRHGACARPCAGRTHRWKPSRARRCRTCKRHSAAVSCGGIRRSWRRGERWLANTLVRWPIHVRLPFAVDKRTIYFRFPLRVSEDVGYQLRTQFDPRRAGAARRRCAAPSGRRPRPGEVSRRGRLLRQATVDSPLPVTRSSIAGPRDRRRAIGLAVRMVA